MKRGRPKTPTPSASTERSRKSRERAARKPRKEKIIDKHMAYLGPRHFASIPQPTEPITVELPSPRSAAERRTRGPSYGAGDARRTSGAAN